MEHSLAKLQKIFSDILEINPEQVTERSTMDNLDEWDSMKHLELVMSIESEFNVSFEVHEIVELNTVEKIIEILEEKIA
ncbi:MAG: acyl carrier protein [Bacteriovorax sp.]|nr:acyl carrier protein [Bacteriovorax sp.]